MTKHASIECPATGFNVVAPANTNATSPVYSFMLIFRLVASLSSHSGRSLRYFHLAQEHICLQLHKLRP